MLYILKNGDKPVLKFDLEENYIEVINNQFLPISLKDFVQTTDYTDIKKSMQDIVFLRDYLSNRVLNLSRDNAKEILNSVALSQSLKTEERIKITIKCQGLSMIDNFWICEESDKRSFRDVCLRSHRLGDAAFPISILGKKISATKEIMSPDIGTGGMFAKSWDRTENGIYLLKSDKTTEKINVYAEVEASDILDKFGVNHVHYSLVEKEVLCSSCKCIADDELSIVDGTEVSDYCLHHGTSLLPYMESHFLEDTANMIVIDYLIANTDRHLGNIHFFVDNKTNEIIGLTPLFDHNQSLIADKIGTDVSDLVYDLTEKTMKESAEEYFEFATIKSPDSLPEKVMDRLTFLENNRRQTKE